MRRPGREQYTWLSRLKKLEREKGSLRLRTNKPYHFASGDRNCDVSHWAALQDMLTVIRRRFHETQILLAPVVVQVQSSTKYCGPYNTWVLFQSGCNLILGRGGGSRIMGI